MLHKLKPVPRALVILVIVGGVGFALTQVDFAKLMPAKKAAPEAVAVEAPAVTTVAPPTQSAPPVAITPQPAQPAPVQQAPAPAKSDAGLNNLLK